MVTSFALTLMPSSVCYISGVTNPVVFKERRTTIALIKINLMILFKVVIKSATFNARVKLRLYRSLSAYDVGDGYKRFGGICCFLSQD